MLVYHVYLFTFFACPIFALRARNNDTTAVCVVLWLFLLIGLISGWQEFAMWYLATIGVTWS
jgi:hypothetical protein